VNWRLEHLKLTRALLKANLSREMDCTVRRWHGIESLRYAVECFRDGNFQEVGSGAKAAFEADPLWPLGPARELGFRAYNKLAEYIR
jgi:hypothetical protein